jgi:hypothetical protein
MEWEWEREWEVIYNPTFFSYLINEISGIILFFLFSGVCLSYQDVYTQLFKPVCLSLNWGMKFE